MSLQNNDPLSVIGKGRWIQEFLSRVESSVLTTAQQLNHEEAVTAILEQETTPMGWFSLLSSPQVSAYFNQDTIDGLHSPVTLEELLSHDMSEVSLEAHTPVVVTTPHNIFLTIVRNMGRGSQGEHSRDTSIIAKDSHIYKTHVPRIVKALNILEEFCPEYYELVSTFLQQMIFVDEKASFRGATSYYARGLSYFRPRESWSELVWAEELVHESTHNYMQSLTTFDPLLVGENSLIPKIPGPLRSDLRHHYGNFQSVHVLSRLVRLNNQLIQAGFDKAHLQARNNFLLTNVQNPFKLLCEDAEFSAVGQEIFDVEVRTVFDPNFYEEDTSWFRKTPCTLLQS